METIEGGGLERQYTIVGKTSKGRIVKGRIIGGYKSKINNKKRWLRPEKRLKRLRSKLGTGRTQPSPTKNVSSIPKATKLIKNEERFGEPMQKILQLYNSSRNKVEADELDQEKPTIFLLHLIFNPKMLVNQLQFLNIDTSARSLMKLTPDRVVKGHLVLKKIEDALKEKQNADVIKEILISFCRITKMIENPAPKTCYTSPVMFDTCKMILSIFSDIIWAQSIQKEMGINDAESFQMLHKMQKLNFKLRLEEKDSLLFKTLKKCAYVHHICGRQYFVVEDVWQLEYDDNQSSDSTDDVGTRKLLWNLCSIGGMVGTILNGHRMSEFDEEMGKAIYFYEDITPALQTAMTQATLRRSGVGQIVYLFMSEVQLGRVKTIDNLDQTIADCPSGYDSVLGLGQFQQDFSKENELKMTMKFDDFIMDVPLSASVKSLDSTPFIYDKYAVYNKKQTKLRYLLKIALASLHNLSIL